MRIAPLLSQIGCTWVCLQKLGPLESEWQVEDRRTVIPRSMAVHKPRLCLHVAHSLQVPCFST